MSDVRKISFDDSEGNQLPEESFSENFFRNHKTLSQKLAEEYIQSEAQAKELTETIHVLRRDLATERRQLEALHTKYRDLMGEKTAQEEQVRSTQLRMSHMEEQLNLVLGHNKDLEDQRGDLNKRFQKTLFQFQSLSGKWSEAEGHLKAVAGSAVGLGNIKSWLGQVRRFIAQQEKNKKELLALLAKKENELQSQTLLVGQIQQQSTELKARGLKMHQEKELLEQKLKQLVQEQNRQNQNVGQAAAALQAELVRLKSDNARLMAELQERAVHNQLSLKSEQALKRENLELQDANSQLRQANSLLREESLMVKQAVSVIEKQTQSATQIYEKQIEEYSKKVNVLESQLAVANEQKAQAQAASQNNEITKSKEYTDALRRVSEMTQVISELEDKAENLSLQKQKAEKALEQTEKSLRFAELNAGQYSEQLQAAYQDVKNLKSEVENIDRKLALTLKQLHEREQQLLKVKENHEKTAHQITTKDTEIQSLHQQIQILVFQLSETKENLSKTVQRIVEKEQELTESENKFIEIKEKFEKSNQQLKAKEDELNVITEKLHGIEKQVVESQSRYEDALQKLALVEKNYKIDKSRLEAVIATNESTIATQDAKIMSHESENERLQFKITAYESQQKRMSEDISLLQDQNDKLVADISDDKSSLNEERRAFEVRLFNLEMREKQLTAYSESLNKMKAGLKEQMARFDYELQMARSVNPIADYLKITEREIRRIDLQLKKTPTMSRERLRLEECLEELFEQRDFLVGHSKRTQTDLDSRRQRLQKLLGGDVLQSSPPVPPRRIGGD